MGGSITIALVVACFSVASVTVGILMFFNSKYQSKEEASKAEIHAREMITNVESDVAKLRQTVERISDNVSYIRGRLDPNK